MTALPADTTPRRVLFVTGRLAEPALRRTLAEMAPAFAYDVAVMKITVAALMTTPWIARFLVVPAGTAAAPSYCRSMWPTTWPSRPWSRRSARRSAAWTYG